MSILSDMATRALALEHKMIEPFVERQQRETTQGGIISFLDPTNPELLVKVLNGCGINHHYWLFYAATTDLGFELAVEDTPTGTVVTYTNPDRATAATVTDTSAFATCP